MYKLPWKSQSVDEFVKFASIGYKANEKTALPTFTLPPPRQQAQPTETKAAESKEPEWQALVLSYYNKYAQPLLQQYGLETQEAAAGVGAVFAVFILGFVFGRLTAKTTVIVQDAKKSQ